MRRPYSALALFTACLLASSALIAADFWESKPFLEWSEKETDKILNDSPWAVLMAVPLPNQGPVPSADPGTGPRGGGGGGGGGRDGFGPGPQRVRLTLSWRSALPLKQALARQQAGKNGTLTSEGAASLEREDDLYVVAIRGLPPQYTRTGPNSIIEGHLRRPGKSDIGATQARAQMMPGGVVLMIGFPRTDPIVLTDDEIELDVKIGRLEIKRKFKLKQMVYRGALAM